MVGEEKGERWGGVKAERGEGRGVGVGGTEERRG